MGQIKTKADVEFHRDGWHTGRDPAVNVKVYRSFDDVPLPLEKDMNPSFTMDWVREHVPDDELSQWFDIACREGWEQLDTLAKEIWGNRVTVEQQGRSGGWVVVPDLKDFDSWDAIDLMRWRRFAKGARAEADDIPYRMLDSLYYNVFEPEQQRVHLEDCG